MKHLSDLTIRPATPADDAALERIAQFDSARRPRGRVLLGEVAGEVIAAVSLTSGHVVANPFKHTAEAVRMLSLRREQLAQPALPEPSRVPRLVRRWATRS
jgi:hypothetical protein